LVRNEAGDEVYLLLATASFAGLLSAFIIGTINSAAGSATSGNDLLKFAQIVLALVLYIVCARRTFQRTTALVESAVKKLKLNLIGQLKRADFQQLEAIGASIIHDQLTQNLATISQSASMIGITLQSICVLICASIYIIWISVPAFALLLLLNIVGAKLWLAQSATIPEKMRAATEKRVKFIEQLTDFLKGAKEIRFSRKRSEDIDADVQVTAEETRSLTVMTNRLFDDLFILSHCHLFSLLIAVVFVLPKHATLEQSALTSLVGGVLFFWGPLVGTLTGMPNYVRASAALRDILALKKDLEQAALNCVPAEHAVNPWEGRFFAIDVRNSRFTYKPTDGRKPFEIGPIDLSIKAGEVIFIVGDNGSGKSTLLKVLMGLYLPTEGDLLVDKVPIEPRNVAAYREMISVIFSDFHLFSRLYGLLDVEEKTVLDLLGKMHLADKTSFVDGAFTTRELSTGQRKRLAMVVALLEDCPIFMFDEWAADQDPEFRKFFYYELIPSLKSRGKTVIAVSHDDRYFHCADCIVTIECGKVRSIERRGEPGSSGAIGSSQLQMNTT